MSAQPIVGGGGPSNHSIYDIKTEQAHPLGTRGFLPDGRVFYYARNTGSSALTSGQLMVPANLATAHQNLATATTCLVEGASKIVDVTVGAAAISANDFKEGYLAVTDGGGQGHIYQIRSHDAISSAGTGDFNLYGSVPSAGESDAGTTVSLFYNQYDSPQASVADQLDIPCGVPTTTLPAGDTTTQYGWLQTWGPCAVLFDESIAALAQAVTIGSSTAGSVEEDDTATTVSQEFIVGYTMSVGVDTEYQVVDLRIRA